ncbi:MAG: DUF4923 family protein [Candidatus Dadabacteria bacterium]|nr:DUF4923 family protein [Candidatus Dadabacteria bacterium]NIS08706.1 DUF4923 family protein [Candidatus Dadabacteria bacterium]NIV42188.1 DUF4923 family protein [Candidatus Dadabacteria bacterium]NIX15392.1 DUF4923 family protein [Candidatus Dadabacteria bacterium]NIY22055.1 DUF4923 family protein [Candidatus Dadabacteria bacterium]
MNRRSLSFVFPLLIAVFIFSSCDMISGFLNPFTGSWKSGLFNFTFNDDKTFKLEIGSGLSFKTEGTYEYDKENLILSFSKDSKTTFSYAFNEDKSELTLTPKTEFKWFKTALKFIKTDN